MRREVNLTTGEVVDVPLTEAEAAQIALEAAAEQARAVNDALDAQIAALEALQTPRLLREALKKKGCVVNKPGTIIHGLSPADAVDAIDAAVVALRAQLTGDVYYQAQQA